MLNSSIRATLVFALALVASAGLPNAQAQTTEDSSQVTGQELRARPFFTAPSAGNMKTVAGTGTYGYTGDGGPAINAEISNPYFEAFDASGNLYFVSDRPGVIREVNAATGVITTVAGVAFSRGYGGDNGPATSATFNYPASVAFDSQGNMYIADAGNGCIRMVAKATGTITTVAGTGAQGFSGDGGVPTAAQFYYPAGIAFDSSGNLYIADEGNNRIRKITPKAGVIATGTITTVAGTGAGDYNGDGIAATTADLNYPTGIAVDASGNLYIGDNSNARVRKVTKSTGLISTIAGTGIFGNPPTNVGSTTAATSIQIGSPAQVTLDSAGNVYFADSNSAQIYKVAAATGYFSVVAGTGTNGFSGDGPAIYSELWLVGGVVSDGSGNVFIADYNNALIREVAPGTSTQTGTPYFSPTAYTISNRGFIGGQTVEILDAQPNAVIYYTTGGSTPTTSSTVYSQPIAVNAATTINAIAQAPSFTVSQEGSLALTAVTAATPTFSPAPFETYTSAQNVTIADSTPGATIYYTTALPAPTASSPVYTSPVLISATGGAPIYAIAAGPGLITSDLAYGAYTINSIPPIAPTISPNGGTFTTAQTVVISEVATAQENVTFYYTTDGSTPTTSSSRSTGPVLLTVSTSETVKAIAVVDGWPNGPVATANFVISSGPAMPTFSPPAGATYTSVQTVTISDTTPGVTIYYNTTNTPPTTSSTLYTGPITVSSSEYLAAIAVQSGQPDSPEAIGYYTINLPTVSTPTFSLAAGTYTGTQNVTITDSTPGVTIYYTTNGSTPTTSSATYTAPITVSSTETIQAIATIAGQNNSAVASALYTIILPAPATPTFSPAAGNYTSMPTVTISDATTGANIYFTTDGTTPTTSSPGYNGPIVVRSAETINAIAGQTGHANSAVASAAYTLTAGTPSFSPVAGTYTAAKTVALSSATPGATIYYTTDGSTPTTSSAVYSGPLTVSSTETIEAFAAESNFTTSAISTALYTINIPVAATPTFSPVGGTYTSPQTVTISDTTTGATIYYTTNGTTPTTSSMVYGGPVLVSSSETLEAIAAETGYTTSGVATAAYTINIPVAATPIISPGSGSYIGPQTVNISDTTPGATIYYTTNGSTPTTSSAVYSIPITVSASETVEAIAAATNYTTSAVASAAFTLSAATPTFSPAGGNYSSAQTVTISDATPGVTIFYTTDGRTPTGSNATYTSPITVSTSETVQAIALGTGYGYSAVGSATYTLNFGTAATPTISPAGGPFLQRQTVTITDTTPSSSIYYTTDGSTPTTASAPYGGPFVVSSTSTVQAIATAPNYTNSGVATATFSLTAATPTFSPAAGTYISAQNVSISDATTGATIYYTTNGTTPTTSSTMYTGPITVSSSETIEAIAAESGYASSAAASAAYTINLPAAKPTLSPSSGTYYGPQVVTIADTMPGATIYYTTNGTTPTTASTPYSGSFTVSTSETVEAIAVASGYSSSPVGSAIYTLQAATPAISPQGAVANAPVTVTISDTTPGAVIYYTTNGATPTTGSTKYTSSFTVSSTETVVALAVATGYNNSATIAAYFQLNTANPVVTPAGGTFAGTQTVTMSDITPGAVIYYTTNGKTPTTSSTQYGAPFVLSSSEQIVAMAVAPCCGTSGFTSEYFTLVPATPTFSPAAGTYTTVQTVAIKDATSGTTIYYTTNGAAPLIGQGGTNLYTGPLTVSSSETIQAIAVYQIGSAPSATASASYTINLPTAATPTFSPAAGTYTSVQTVTLKDTTSGATVYYTTDGSTPTTSSTKYTSSIAVSSSETVNAIAVAANYKNSAVGSAAYTLNLPAAAPPTFSPATGTYSSSQTVSIKDTTTGATIYYTTDGSTPTTSSTKYTNPFTVSSSENISAIAAATGYTNSAVASATYTLPAAKPAFSPAAGTYNSAQTVTISDTTPGATIYFTTNGSTPSTSSTVYSGSITVSSSETIKAIAAAVGSTNSAVASAAYTLAVATPVFSPAVGTYASSQAVTISDTTPGATIYYTTNGATPTTSSTVYSGAITVSSSETIKAIAAETGYTTSAAASAAYTLTVATPTFSPAAGTYSSSQTASISDTTPGATIYYTTNGTTPTTSSTKYASPISVSSSVTIKAIAAETGYTTSAVASAAFTLTVATPTFSPVAGTYTSLQTVSIGDTTPGVTIYYTTNGSSPTTSSTKYTSPITVSTSETVEAIAVATGYNNSAVGTAAYTLNLPAAATPVIRPQSGTIGPQTVVISDTTSGATIYYTTNGSTPTTSSSLYLAPFLIPSTGTIKAIAALPGYSQSAVASATYTIDPYDIATVSAILPKQTQTITITGSGFGTSGTGANLYFYDNTKGWAAGAQLCPNFCLAISSWTDKQIVLTGLTGSYGVNGASLSNGDKITLTVANAQGAAALDVQCTNIVVGAGQTACTSATGANHLAPMPEQKGTRSEGNIPRR